MQAKRTLDRETKIDELMKGFVAAWEAGSIDPKPFLEKASPDEQEDLGRRIDLFLLTVPPRKWDSAGFAASPAEVITDRVIEASRCPSGAWPEVIPALMIENRLRREEVVAELADEIGAGEPAEVEQVDDYFHRMTWGTLDASGVSDRVLDTLGRILKTSGEALRDAGRALGRKSPMFEGDGSVYARTPSDPSQVLDYGTTLDAGPEISGGSSRIDRLFTGGPSAGAGD